MAEAVAKKFETPDEVRTPPKTRVEVVTLGGATAMRAGRLGDFADFAGRIGLFALAAFLRGSADLDAGGRVFRLDGAAAAPRFRGVGM